MEITYSLNISSNQKPFVFEKSLDLTSEEMYLIRRSLLKYGKKCEAFGNKEVFKRAQCLLDKLDELNTFMIF